MMKERMITSLANRKVKKVAALNRSPKERLLNGQYVVEGVKLFCEAPVDEVEEVYLTEGFCPRPSASDCREKLAVLSGLGRVEYTSPEVFARMSDTQTPQGILCVMRARRYPLEALLGERAPLLMILEDIGDPGNLGTMLRTAEGAGVSGVIMNRGCVDIYNPKTIRATMGSIYRMPFILTDDLPETVRSLKRGGITLYAAHLSGTCCYDEEDYTRASAFMIGNEARGLSDGVSGLADRRIRIPMQGQVESLNAAMAAGVLAYEASRQRRRGKNGGP